MNDLPHLLKKARRTVLSCAVTLSLTLTALGSVLWYDRNLAQRCKSAEQAHAALLAEQTNLAENLQAVTSGQSVFLTQQRQGLIGKAAREQWAQSLIAAYQAQQFSGVPDYTLKAPVPFALGGAAAAATTDPALATAAATSGSPASGGAASVAVQAHELQFNLTQAHEIDVLAIVSQLQTKYAGLMQFDHCTLTDPKPEGLRASCSLKFFNLSRPDSTAATVVAAGAPATTR
jgi:hypothetical protein